MEQLENNEIEKVNEEERALSLILDTDVSHEVSEEFSLPDYVPEVRKIIKVTSEALPEGKYLNDTGSEPRLELTGTVTYSVIYTDDEGKLCAVPLTTGYEFGVNLARVPHISNIKTSVEGVTYRVIAPRKLTMKSKLKSRVIAFENNEVKENITPRSGAEEIYLERCQKEISALEIKEASLQNIRISERLESIKEQQMQPIWCDAHIILTDVKPQKDLVCVRGEVSIRCLLSGDGCEDVIYKTVPLSEEIESEGTLAGDMARAHARCVSLSISSEEKDGENALFFDLTCEIEATTIRNGEISVTTDAYSTKNETEATYKSMEYFKGLKAQNGSFTLSESKKRENKEISEIIAVLADPVYEKSETKGAKIYHHGKLLVDVIGKKISDTDGEVQYMHDYYELPIKYEADMGKATKSIMAQCDFSIGKQSARYDDESFYLTAEIFVSHSVYEKCEALVLDQAIIKTDKEVIKDSSCVRVCFPREGETLWDIAKRYHTTKSKIKEQNDIENEDLRSVQSLII